MCGVEFVYVVEYCFMFFCFIIYGYDYDVFVFSEEELVNFVI